MKKSRSYYGCLSSTVVFSVDKIDGFILYYVAEYIRVFYTEFIWDIMRLWYLYSCHLSLDT